MKQLVLIVAVAFASTANAQSKTQWESAMDAQLTYIIAKLTDSTNCEAEKAAMYAALLPFKGLTLAQIHTKMVQYYGSEWQRRPGPAYTGCRIVCSIIYSIQVNTNCEATGGNPSQPTSTLCQAMADVDFADCARLCGGLIPLGL